MYLKKVYGYIYFFGKELFLLIGCLVSLIVYYFCYNIVFFLNLSLIINGMMIIVIMKYMWYVNDKLDNLCI